MSEPSVCAIMLTRDRLEYARRAVERFREQTYSAKTLLVVNSGSSPILEAESGFEKDMMEPCFIGADAQSIGELRNRAAQYTSGHGVDILIHWDDDDFSHQNRIAEQVALLQSTGADVVGFNEMLFWREPTGERFAGYARPYKPGEAWLYTNRNPTYALGTSLCYWRKTWERKAFEATSHGEDHRFCTGLRVAGVPSGKLLGSLIGLSNVKPSKDAAPRMIARIHAGNSSGAYDPAKMQRAAEWKRVPEWDSYCERVMK